MFELTLIDNGHDNTHIGVRRWPTCPAVGDWVVCNGANWVVSLVIHGDWVEKLGEPFAVATVYVDYECDV